MRRIALSILPALLLATFAHAAQPDRPAGRAVGLRGAQAAASPAKAQVLPAASDRPVLTNDDPTASGVLAGSDRARSKAGGARCRQACAQDLYLCRSNRDESDCSPIWSQCVVACPEDSSDPL